MCSAAFGFKIIATLEGEGKKGGGGCYLGLDYCGDKKRKIFVLQCDGILKRMRITLRLFPCPLWVHRTEIQTTSVGCRHVFVKTLIAQNRANSSRLSSVRS